ncbi:MAG: GNAT family N-acetyltransferase [Hyphomicrobiales bacterium]
MSRAEIYKQVAQLHMAALSKGFLARLGPPFLALLYEKIDQTPAYHLITHEIDGRVVGFVSGGPGMGSIYRALLSSWPRLAISLIPNILIPKKLWGVFELLQFKRRDENPHSPRYELLSIAVSAENRGTDIAPLLYQSLSCEFRRAGVDEFKIVVGDTLERAQKFYMKMQARPSHKVEVHGGVSSTVFLAHL